MKELIFDLLAKNVGVNVTIEQVKKIKMYIEELENRSKFLSALEEAGVDNWCWYGEAWEIYNGWDD